MPSNPPTYDLHNAEQTPFCTPISRPAARRSLSRSRDSYIGISEEFPLSWEQIPAGIPKTKHQAAASKKKELGRHPLPLPPPAGKSKLQMQQDERDPFLAALLECSKDDHSTINYAEIRKNFSDKFGFININIINVSSCKRTSCAVSESIVRVPRSSPHHLLNRR